MFISEKKSTYSTTKFVPGLTVLCIQTQLQSIIHAGLQECYTIYFQLKKKGKIRALLSSQSARIKFDSHNITLPESTDSQLKTNQSLIQRYMYLCISVDAVNMVTREWGYFK